MSRFFLLLLFLTCLSSPAICLKVLGLFPHFGKSHYIMFEQIMKELAHRGHEAHVYSYFPQKTPIKNFYDYDIGDKTQTFELLDMSYAKYMNAFSVFSLLVMTGYSSCDEVLAHKEIQDLYKSNKKFDVILIEAFNCDCMLPFVEKFNVPYIFVSSSVPMPWHYSRFGNPDNPSYIPNHYLPLGSEMTYIQRVKNTVVSWTTRFLYTYVAFPINQYLVNKHLNPPADIYAISQNSSLYLLNTHPTVTGARLLGPSTIEVGGIHLKPPAKLPNDLAKWMDEATDGIIYFSLGSLVQGSSIPEDKLKIFVDVFRNLKQKIIWKWETEFPNKPKNLLVSKWLPQRDILAHPKIVLFISHCGLMGTLEGVDSGVPMLCMPILGDQPSNQGALEQLGSSLKFDYSELTKEHLQDKINQILQPKFQQQAKKLQKAFRDRPNPPMDTAIYWIEYVAKHGGTEPLQLASKKLYWYQQALLDVVLLLGLLFGIYIIFSIFILRCICCRKKKTQSPSTTTTTTSKKKKKQ